VLNYASMRECSIKDGLKPPKFVEDVNDSRRRPPAKRIFNDFSFLQQEGITVNFNKQVSKDYRAQQSKRRNERVGVVLIILLVSSFVGVAEAVLVGVAMAVYALSEIDSNLCYANFLKERELGLHDIED